MSAADVACYSAKDSGRNRIQTYRQGRAPERHREMQWVSRINRACEENRLLLYCQPIVPIRAGVEKLRYIIRTTGALDATERRITELMDASLSALAAADIEDEPRTVLHRLAEAATRRRT